MLARILHTFLLLVLASFVHAGLPNIDIRPLGSQHSLNLAEHYGGEVLLMVNLPEGCHQGRQFESLQALYQRYRGKGFTVLGLVLPDVAGDQVDQILNGEQEVLERCRKKGAITFPLFSLSGTLGGRPEDLYRWFKDQGGKYLMGSFKKFLISRKGQLRIVFPKATRPEDVRLSIAINHELTSGEVRLDNKAANQ